MAEQAKAPGAGGSATGPDVWMWLGTWVVCALALAATGIPILGAGDVRVWLVVLAFLPLTFGLEMLDTRRRRWDQARDHRQTGALVAWATARGWTDLHGALPSLARAADWRTVGESRIHMSAEGDESGLPVALALERRWEGEDTVPRTIVWVGRRTMAPGGPVTIRRRVVGRGWRGSPATGVPEFDRYFAVRPREAVTGLPRRLVACLPGLVGRRDVTILSPGVVTLVHRGRLGPDRVGPVVAAATAAAEAAEPPPDREARADPPAGRDPR